MRPRPDAAENFDGPAVRQLPLVASMRPRPDAAENGHRLDLAGDHLAALQ